VLFRAAPVGEPIDDKEKYLRWLEEMWEVQKLDIYGSTEREEKRKEEVLKIFEGLAHLSKHRLEAPTFLGDPPAS
jgi:hypothetical protein